MRKGRRRFLLVIYLHIKYHMILKCPMSDVTKQFQIFCATQRTYSNVVKHTQAIRSRVIFDCN